MAPVSSGQAHLCANSPETRWGSRMSWRQSCNAVSPSRPAPGSTFFPSASAPAYWRFPVAGEGLWKAGRSPELCGHERPTHLSASSSSLLPEGEKATFWNGDRSPKAARAAGVGRRAGSTVSRSPGDGIPFSSQVLQVRLVASNLLGPRPEFPGFPPPWAPSHHLSNQKLVNCFPVLLSRFQGTLCVLNFKESLLQ